MSLTIHGRFFHCDDERVFLRAVTYGPFPPGKELDAKVELPRIAAAGFHAVRTYQTPSREFLDELQRNGLLLIATVPWHWDSLFVEEAKTLSQAREALADFLTQYGEHSALGALLIANEIRPDLVRYMGPQIVRNELENLIEYCHKLSPQLPIGYASFPTTEYLEPRNADFSAFNVYLEQQENFESYLRRLQNIAGDRPLLLTEFGFNTWHADEAQSQALEEQQAETLRWAEMTAQREGTAGFTVYSWSDRWFTGGREVIEWSFGLTRRDGSAKSAFAAMMAQCSDRVVAREAQAELFTVAICTRNGGCRLRENLRYFESLEDDCFELIIIDDGSTDETCAIVEAFIATSEIQIRLLSQEPSGLSVARNYAAREGKGELIVYIDDDARPHPLWLYYLRAAFIRNPQAVAAGGPNLPPVPSSWQNAVVTACPGNASHILFDDVTAEHLPGCNFALKREVLLAVGGFESCYHAAGDDVDVCWRLLDAGYELAFHANACVFHDRRATIRGFLRQQAGYGEAEALLYQRHPQRFGSDGIRWEGFIYSGAPLSLGLDSVIYHGPMGEAPFQMLALTQMPLRPLHRKFDTSLNRLLVRCVNWWAQYCRRQARKKHGGPVRQGKGQGKGMNRRGERLRFTQCNFTIGGGDGLYSRSAFLEYLLGKGWQISADEAVADLERGPSKMISAETPLEGGAFILHVRLLYSGVEDPEFWNQVQGFFKAGDLSVISEVLRGRLPRY